MKALVGFQPGEGPSRGLLCDCENRLWNRWSTTQHYSSRPGCPASRAAAAVKWDCTCNSSSRAQPGFVLSGSAAVVPVLVPGSHWCQGAQSEVVCQQPHSATHLPSHHHWCSVPTPHTPVLGTICSLPCQCPPLATVHCNVTAFC